MIFKFDQKIMSLNRDKPSVFHLPPGSDFTKNFVEGLLSRFEPGVLVSNPELLGRLKILTSNRTLTKQIEEKLQSHGFIILPDIVQLNDLSDFFYATPIKKIEADKGRSDFHVISSLERLLLLENLIKEAQGEEFSEITKVSSFDLAKSLESLIDELNTNNVGVNDLTKITEEELSQHLQLNLLLMRRVVLRYKKELMQRELIDKSSKYILDVNNLINHWQLEPYCMPLLIVGSTGSQKATAKLMHAISKLPQGLVVLPGLDPYLTNRSWTALTPDHPQYGFLSLSKTWGLTNTQHNEIIKAPCWYKAVSFDSSIDRRAHFFSLLMRPAPVTDEWRSEGKSILDNLNLALDDISLIEAENSRLEAAAICVSIKEAVSEGSTVALISPSKQIARRVTAELKRWKIVPDNSLGISLAATELGIFLRQGALVLTSDFEFNNVIALLKNRNCGGEYANHSINIVKLQRAPQQPTMSFLDLAGNEWLNAQDEEFIKWYNWLLKLFKDLRVVLEVGFLSTTVTLHKRFSQSLINGFSTEKGGLESFNDQMSCWKTDTGIQILTLLNQLSNLSKKNGKYEFWGYKQILEDLLSETNFIPVSDRLTSSVFIWGTLESRTQHADVFILSGLNEGVWPGYYKDDPWLNRSMRSAIGVDLLERKIGLSAHDFQQAAMTKKLILSRSKRQNNLPAVSSRWLLRFENLLVGLGEDGIKYLTDVKSRGEAFLKLAREFYLSDSLTIGLPREVKSSAVRPAPIPPLITRPNRLSVTEIQTLIKNPYSVYAKQILNLRKIENFQHTSDPRNKGNLVHTTMEKFIGEHINELPDFNESCELLKEKFNLILEGALIPIEVKSLWKAQFEIRTNSIVHSEAQRRLAGRPVALEVYGKYKIYLKTGEFFLITAKVDRVDKGTDGFIIYDYKTGQISRRELENDSPQLDIEALMLENGSFEEIPKGKVFGLCLVGLGASPQQYLKNVKAENIEEWQSGLLKLIRRMKLELSAFPARLLTDKNKYFSDEYDHLSRYGEWGDNESINELMLELIPKNLGG